MSAVAPVPIDGLCDTRFTAVREAFANNFAQHGEIGAAAVLFVGGRKVVDLWGGWADRGRTRPWAEDTLVNVYSIGKAITATCVLLLVQRGQLDLDAPVTRWWPEFGAAGKAAVTLRQLMSHRGGMPAIRELLPAGLMLDWDRMTGLLAAQAPWWTPGQAHGYHVNTFGYLLGEPVRRAAGMTLGTLLRQEIAGPLDADVHIGLPASEHGRVADFLHPQRTAPAAGAAPPAAPKPPTTEVDLMRALTYGNPPGVSGTAEYVNTAAWRMAEIPSTNGHGNARGVARIYRALLEGLIEPDLLGEATSEHSHGQDLILDRPSRFGLGYQLTQAERPLGPNLRGFGHFGAGGSLGFCDPDAGVAFGYVMNDMGPRWQNPRNGALIEAIYRSL
jgi:CubicO group peptidase (beta-lactamase class C family)